MKRSATPGGGPPASRSRVDDDEDSGPTELDVSFLREQVPCFFQTKSDVFRLYFLYTCPTPPSYSLLSFPIFYIASNSHRISNWRLPCSAISVASRRPTLRFVAEIS